jgi:hypothetical protein
LIPDDLTWRSGENKPKGILEDIPETRSDENAQDEHEYDVSTGFSAQAQRTE